MKDEEQMLNALWEIRDALVRLCEVQELAQAEHKEAMRKSEERMEQGLRNQAELLAAQQEIADATTSAANKRNQ